MKFSFHEKQIKKQNPRKTQTLNFIHSNVSRKQIRDVIVVTAKFKFSKKTVAETTI